MLDEQQRKKLAAFLAGEGTITIGDAHEMAAALEERKVETGDMQGLDPEVELMVKIISPSRA